MRNKVCRQSRALSAIRLHASNSGAERRGNTLAVVCLDLDNFKGINDRHGHTVGDELLTTVAHRMASTLRHDDTLPASEATNSSPCFATS